MRVIDIKLREASELRPVSAGNGSLEYVQQRPCPYESPQKHLLRALDGNAGVNCELTLVDSLTLEDKVLYPMGMFCSTLTHTTRVWESGCQFCRCLR